MATAPMLPRNLPKKLLRYLYYGTRGLFAGYRVGLGTKVAWSAVITRHRKGSVEIGRDCRIARHAIIEADRGRVRIGDNVTINPFTVLYGHGGLTIGNGVRIAAHCVLVASSHVYADPERPIWTQGVTMKGIAVGNDVWIGANVTVLDGVQIGDGCVVAAGAVVNRSTEPYGVYAGVPARRVKERA